MFRRAARIRALAVILFVLFLVPAAQAGKELQPGINHMHLNSQLISGDKRGRIKFSAFALYNRPVYPHAIGNSVVRCGLVGQRRTLVPHTQICAIVFRMPLGSIVAAGVVSSRVYFKLALVGGTGIYNNISGEVQVITTSLKPLKWNLNFYIIAN